MAGRRGNAVISSGRWLLEKLPKCIPEWCWRVPSRSLERQQGQGFSNCICSISLSSFGCDPPSWGISLSEGGRIAVFGT